VDAASPRPGPPLLGVFTHCQTLQPNEAPPSLGGNAWRYRFFFDRFLAGRLACLRPLAGFLTGFFFNLVSGTGVTESPGSSCVSPPATSCPADERPDFAQERRCRYFFPFFFAAFFFLAAFFFIFRPGL
jgi:hypothetical protein